MPGELLAITRPWGIDDICIAGRCFSIPPLAASAWLDILTADVVDSWAVVPGLFPDEDAGEHILDALESGQLDQDDYADLVRDVITTAAGRDWWVATALLANAESDAIGPLIRGELVVNGIDPARISLPALLDAIYFLFTRGMTPDQRQKFDNLIAMPPPGIRVKIDRDKQRSVFEAMMASD